MPDPVFVTGGSGVVGKPLVTRLVQRGLTVRALARSDASARTVAELGAEPVRGDLMRTRALAQAMDGCATVFHVAGVNAFCVRDDSELFTVNVLGALTVVRAAAQAGVRRVVYTSSAATLGERAGVVGHEDSPHRGFFLSAYERSKFEAERAAFPAAARRGLEFVSVNPSSVQGPGRAGGTARLLRWYVDGKLPAVVATHLSLVDVDDCAEGHILAAERGRSGRRYVLNGATIDVRDALSLIGRVAHVDHGVRIVPAWLAVAAAGAIETAARIAGRQPPVCREIVRSIAHGHAYDGSRATRELGLEYTPLEDTLARTIEWFRREGLVSRGAR